MRWQAVTDAFEKARTLPPGERAAFLREYCGADAELLRETESLLKAYEESGDFLEGLAIDQAGRDVLDSIPGGMIGERLGVYRIMRRIGEGGMGEVYEAERADGEFRQRVAIKVVRQDFPHRSHERFRAERQILSDLNHPHIARLLDGGATPAGAPYLVMELIEGQPIDRYCQKLEPAGRLELFAKVCDAVEYANRQQVIHCDIKPGNILVTADGTPKLLDFGISRLLLPTNENTETQTRAATPEYASPEQLAGQKITAASDIYSLGVVLRKLAPALSKVIARATDPQPEKRYPSAAALANAVRQEAGGRWSRRAIMAASVTGIAAAGLGGIAWWRYRGSMLAQSDALAVMRIENRTGDKDLDWADRGIADLLATNFAQAGGFEVISTARSRELLERTSNHQREAANLARAGFYVTGDLLRVGSGLRLNLRVEQTATGRIRFAEKFDAANPEAIIALADQASMGILAQLRVAGETVASAGQALSVNPKALRLYEEGCDYYDRWQIPKAVKSFRGAIEIDPHFAMAYYHLATANPWNPPSALRDLDRAVDLANKLRLPARERQVIEANRLIVAGRIAESAAILQEMVRQNPRDAEARILLAGDRMYESNFAEGLKILEEALQIDSNSRFALILTSYAAASAGRFDRALVYADRYTATLQPGDWNGLDLRGDILSYAERFDEAAATYAKVERWAKEGLASMHSGNFDRAEAVLKKGVELQGGPVFLGGCLGFLGDVQVARGKLDDGRKWYEQGIRAYAEYTWYGAMVLWKAAQVYLEQGRPEMALDLANEFAEHPWSAGVQSVAFAMQGKTADAEARLSALRSSVAGILGAYMGERHEELYRIFGAFYRGEHQKVAALAENAPRLLWNFYALAAGRSNLALGNVEAARRHFEMSRLLLLSWGGPGLYEAHNMLAFLLGEFYLGQVAVRHGRSDEARRKFEFFLKFLGRSTARLPQVAEARAAVRA